MSSKALYMYDLHYWFVDKNGLIAQSHNSFTIVPYIYYIGSKTDSRDLTNLMVPISVFQRWIIWRIIRYTLVFEETQ